MTYHYSSQTSDTSPSTLPSSPTSTLTILTNSSIHAISCESGDRWIFLQDLTGSIKGLHSQDSRTLNPSWEKFPEKLNSITAKPRTPLSASCVSIPQAAVQSYQEIDLVAGIYVCPISLESIATSAPDRDRNLTDYLRYP